MKLSEMEGSDLAEYISYHLENSNKTKERDLKFMLKELDCSEHEFILRILECF